MSSSEPHSERRFSRQYSFAEFTLDLEGGFLRRGGDEVALRPKPFEVLVYLVEHHGRLVTKAELTDAVWPDTAVMDNSLAQCLVEIRRVLGDESQQIVRTVPRRGYLFAAPVTTPVIELPRAAAVPPAPRRTRRPGAVPLIVSAAVVLAAIAAGLALAGLRRPAREEPGYEQITSFTDSAVSPALSPDGKMLAFIRSDHWFLTPDQVYVKLLPNGEPVQITHDSRPKYGLAFSRDGSRIVYTVPQWSTYAVSPLGGEPALLLPNSSGVTWLDDQRILFSEANPPGSGHLGVVTAREDRSEQRTIYFPKEERGMVHVSYPSPDRRWVLVLEMDPVWHRCRVVPFDGSSTGREVGPQGHCYSAAWSPDGKWMYFGVEVEGQHHLWRQRFPTGEPEQITSGATEEDGVAVAPDGRSLITSIGMYQSTVWIHDARGDRPVSTQGYVPDISRTPRAGELPRFSPDGKSLFYLKNESPGAPMELWRMDVASEKSEKMLAGASMLEFDISDDGQEVVYSAQPPGKPSQVWTGALDRSSPPRRIAASGEDSPHFGADGRIVYRVSDGTRFYLWAMNRDGSGQSRIVPNPIGNILSMSSDRRWITTAGIGAMLAVPLGGGPPQTIGSDELTFWAPDGRFVYFCVQKTSRTEPGKTWVFPLKQGEMLPRLPPSGLPPSYDPKLFPGSYLIDAYAISPGPDPSIYAYVKSTMHRNLFRIPLH